MTRFATSVVLTALVGASALVGACSEDNGSSEATATSGPSGGNAGGANASSGGDGGTAGHSSGDGGQKTSAGSGGAPSCIDVLDGDCGDCMELMCCDEISDCLSDDGCNTCLLGNELECSDPNAAALLQSVFGCAERLCQQTCFETLDIYSCNPITNAGCDAMADFACDVDLVNGAFICTGPPHSQALCDACGPQDGFCKPGHSCVASQCARFCCDDNDCDANAVCDKTFFAGVGMGEAGVCIDMQAPLQPDCSGLPATPPSGGSCIPFSG